MDYTARRKNGGVSTRPPEREYHKSFQWKASLEKSPTRTRRISDYPPFASLGAYVKLDRLRPGSATNHFALKGRLHLNAMQVSCAELIALKNHLNQQPIMGLAKHQLIKRFAVAVIELYGHKFISTRDINFITIQLYNRYGEPFY